MAEQMFFRNNRWVPRSQILKDKNISTDENTVDIKLIDIEPSETGFTLNEIKDLQDHLSSIELTELRKMAKELGIKHSWAKGKPKLIHDIILKKS